ncbi:MAG: hypothetical protein WCS27_17180 [Victivallaceae bacterium]
MNKMLNAIQKIFAGRYESLHSDRYDDTLCRKLLKYLQDLLHEKKFKTPQLDMLLAGKYPTLNVEKIINDELNIAHDYEGYYFTPLEDFSCEQYEDILHNLFPPVFSEYFPYGTKSLESDENILLTWHLYAERKVREELWYAPDELRPFCCLIYDYINAKISEDCIIMEHFLRNYNHFILSHKWRETEQLQLKLKEESLLREQFQSINAHLAKENEQYQNALKTRYITLKDAARAVLRIKYHKDDVESKADAVIKRLKRRYPKLPIPLNGSGKQGRQYYPVNSLIPLFQSVIKLPEADISCAIRTVGIPRDQLDIQP